MKNMRHLATAIETCHIVADKLFSHAHNFALKVLDSPCFLQAFKVVLASSALNGGNAFITQNLAQEGFRWQQINSQGGIRGDILLTPFKW